MCLNWRVAAALGAVGIAVYALAPSVIGLVLPIMVFAICPLSMIVMMRGMAGGERKAAACGRDEAGQEGELARLRAEVDELRAERAGRSTNG